MHIVAQRLVPRRKVNFTPVHFMRFAPVGLLIRSMCWH
jgi:hypothetical protein